MVNAFVFKRATPAGVVGSVVVGALTAHYLGEKLSRFFGAGAFITGLAGMALCQGLIETAKRWRPAGPLPPRAGAMASLTP